MSYEEKHEEACGVGEVFSGLKIDSGTRVVGFLGCLGFEKFDFFGFFFYFFKLFSLKVTGNEGLLRSVFGDTRVND